MKKYLVFLMLATLTFAVNFRSQAQGSNPISVSGTVLDSKGATIPGVLVYQEGKTSNGTTTDEKGAYKITLPANATLVFSSMGFMEQHEAVNGRRTIAVTLKDDTLLIDAAEVVSVGYGTVARRDLTGSVAKVDMDEITKTPVTNFDQAIQGRIAGVVVSTADGSVGQAADVVIRGNNSITQSSAPLYVIDGFPTEASLATSLNPSDIQSVDVLKDASATAIYGARGANGVIVITTKQGVEGKPTVTFNASWTANQIANKVDLMDSYEFVSLQDEYYKNASKENPYLTGIGADGQKIYDYYTVDDYKNQPTADWQDRIYRTALNQNYNVSLSGGVKKTGTRYMVNLSVLDQQGIIVNSNFSRYQGKINLAQRIGKRAEFTINANYSRSVTYGTNPTSAQQSSSASGWLMYSVWGYRPTKALSAGPIDDQWFEQLVDEEINSSNDYRFNPAKSVQNEYRKTVVDYLGANAALNIDIIQGLRLRISGGYTNIHQCREEFNGSQTYSGYKGSSSGLGINGGLYWTDRTSWLNENTLTYTATWAKNHHFQALGGVTFQGDNSTYRGEKSTRMSTEALGLNGMHTGTYLPVTPWERDWTMMSFLARVNYNYKYRYYLTVSMRADGSSKFPDGQKWGYFPSASLAWNFCQEDWLKNSWILTKGKLRVSYGLTGNNRTTTPYDYYSQITTVPGDTNSMDYVFRGEYTPGYFPNNMANNKLTWETTGQFNVGLDLAFIRDRIRLTADYYIKDTYNLLLNTTLPASSGYTSAMMNIGSMQNQGFEFTLEATAIKTRNVQWDLNFNIGINKNKVTSLAGDQQSLLSKISWDQRFNSQYAYITQVGMPTGMMYGFIYEGTYKEDDFVNGTLKDGVPYLSSLTKSNIKPGDAKYRDVNEDGVVNDNDRTIIGCGQPLNTGGFGTTLNLYGFDLNVFFNWSFGNDILNANRLIFENPTTADLNQFKSVVNRYSASNPTSDIPRQGALGTYVYSSRVVEDGSYLRLKNISLGYTFPSKWMQKIKMQSARIYVSADNIWTLTNYSGPDPEVSTRNSVLTPGFDWSAYPRAWGISGGLSLTF